MLFRSYAVKAFAVLGVVLGTYCGWPYVGPTLAKINPWTETPYSNRQIKAAVDEVKAGVDKLNDELTELRKSIQQPSKK